MNKLIRIHIFALLTILLSVANSANAQQLKVNVKLDTNLIMIGDQLKFNITVEQNRDMHVEFPFFTDTITEYIEIVDRSEIDTTFLTDKLIRLNKEYIITSFDSGFHVIPAFKFPFVINSNKDTILSSPQLLQVYTFQIDSVQGIADIKPPINTPVTFKEVLPYIGYSLVVIVIILLIIWLLLRYFKKEVTPIIRRKAKEPAHSVALKELDKLKIEKLWQQGRYKEYQSLLTDIVRRYIEERYNVPAMEQTSDEIFTTFQEKGLLNKANAEILTQMLTLADYVKFAKHKPSPDENDKSMSDAYDFVINTKLKVDLTSSKEQNYNKDIEPNNCNSDRDTIDLTNN